jgi:hypothetical protein
LTERHQDQSYRFHEWFVSQYDGQRDGQFAIHHMNVGTAAASCVHPDANLSGPRMRIKDVAVFRAVA